MTIQTSLVSAVSDENFQEEVIKSPIPVLVDFWATWCAPCRALAPIFDTAASKYESKVKFVKLDIENSQHTPHKFGVRSIPTLLLFKDGNVIATKIGGNMSASQLSAFIDSAL